MVVGTTFYVPYNKMDFQTVESTQEQLGKGPVVGMIVFVCIAYTVLVFWAWREDQKDQYKVHVITNSAKERALNKNTKWFDFR